MNEPYPMDMGSGEPTQALKIPPHSIDAEQSLLGGLMLDENVWSEVSDKVLEADFYRSEHRLIFQAVQALAAKDTPADVVTVSEWLDNSNSLEKAGGLAYIASLAENTPTAANAIAYAAIVRERSILRQLIQTGTSIAGSGFNTEGRSTKELLDDAEKQVYAIAEQQTRGKGFRPINELLTSAIERIETLYESQDPITGVSTGFSGFDEMTSGLQESDLVIVAGRPSMGKTSFAMNIAESAAIKDGASVAVFSMEMPGEQLAMRLLSSLGRIDAHRMRTGKLTDEDWPRLTSAISIMQDAKFYIDDTPALSPNEIRARCRRISRQEEKLGLIVIDYLQLMQVPGSSENRTTEISEISRSLKALAKELSVPVVALSQLNRSLEQRPNKRPVMSDLRESGAIEQDADVIVFIYRDEVYNEDSPDKGTAEIIISKQRNGPIGTTRLSFLGEYTRFENYISDPYGGGDFG
ncbi:MAG: replicative DNA helicase [Gammaproteobacteria bacterium]